jgi:hypothetical protein
LVVSACSSFAHAEVTVGQRDQGVAVERTKGAPEDAPKVEVMARGSYANLHVGLMGVGIEGAYMRTPHVGFGGTLEAFYVDNGADPHYSASGTLSRGIHALGFVEGDLLKGSFTPYARLSIGAGQYERFQHPTLEGDYARPEPELDFVGQAQMGVALRLGPVLARASVSPSIYGKDALIVYGAALGGRF